MGKIGEFEKTIIVEPLRQPLPEKDVPQPIAPAKEFEEVSRHPRS